MCSAPREATGGRGVEPVQQLVWVLDRRHHVHAHGSEHDDAEHGADDDRDEDRHPPGGAEGEVGDQSRDDADDRCRRHRDHTGDVTYEDIAGHKGLLCS